MDSRFLLCGEPGWGEERWGGGTPGGKRGKEGRIIYIFFKHNFFPTPPSFENLFFFHQILRIFLDFLDLGEVNDF